MSQAKIIKTVQWNIGGGKVRDPAADINVLASYATDGLEVIITQLKLLEPDIITLQEIHADDMLNQVEAIAKALGLPYFVSDFYADSHVEAGQKLGQGIISRFPLSGHTFVLFKNPKLSITWEDGGTATSHDKGVTSCILQIGDVSLMVKTLHSVPFRRFQVDPMTETGQAILADMRAKLESPEPHLLIQGDFNLNFDRYKPVWPQLFSGQLMEIPQEMPTTPKGRKYDHVLYRGLTPKESSAIEPRALTDHFPVVTIFEID